MRSKTLERILVPIFGLLAFGLVHAGDWEAELGGELRIFSHDTRSDEQVDIYPSVFGQVAWNHRTRNRKNYFEAVAFGRYAPYDDERTSADIRELNWLRVGRIYELKLGVSRVFWGVTEAAHLVDIINQTDFVENVNGEDKLGQPMVNLALIGGRSLGTVNLFALPYFRERTFAGLDGRPTTPFPIDEDNAMFEHDDAEHHLDAAIRWKKSLGPIDFALSAFRGNARQPRFLPCIGEDSGVPGTNDELVCDLESLDPNLGAIDGAVVGLGGAIGLLPTQEQIVQQALANLVLVPAYDAIEQYGLELQYNVGDIAFKLEGFHRKQLNRDFNAVTGGFEYTMVGVFETDVDVGVLAEYIYDERDEIYTIFADNDLFVGTRIAFNDVQSTQILGGVIVDKNVYSQAFFVEASRRLGDSYQLVVEANLFTNVAPEDQTLRAIDDDDFIQVELVRYF